MIKKEADIIGSGNVFLSRHINFVPDYEYNIFDIEKKKININSKIYETKKIINKESNILLIFTPPDIRSEIFKIYKDNQIEKVFIEKPVFLNSNDVNSYIDNIGKDSVIYDGYIRNEFNHFKLLKYLFKSEKVNKISFFEQKKWSTKDIPLYLKRININYAVAEVLPHYLAMTISLSELIELKITNLINKDQYSSNASFEVKNCEYLREINFVLSMNYNGLSGTIIETQDRRYFIPLDATNEIFLLDNSNFKIAKINYFISDIKNLDNYDLIVKNLWFNFKNSINKKRNFEFHKKIAIILEKLSIR